MILILSITNFFTFCTLKKELDQPGYRQHINFYKVQEAFIQFVIITRWIVNTSTFKTGSWNKSGWTIDLSVFLICSELLPFLVLFLYLTIKANHEKQKLTQRTESLDIFRATNFSDPRNTEVAETNN